MYIVLLRHAIAEERIDFYRSSNGAPDSERPLTEEGIEKMKLGAQGLVKALNGNVQRVVTSPYVRARQTAEVFLDAIPEAQRPELEFSTNLSSGCSGRGLVEWLTGGLEPVVLVGHEPDMSYWTEELCGIGSFYRHVQNKFGKGGACLIECSIETIGREQNFIWYKSPNMLRANAD